MGATIVAVVVLLIPASANAGHGLRFLDHPAPPLGAAPVPSSTTNSGGQGAEWELIDTFTTGNPHTDIDFFTQGGETYVAAGTLGIGANGGGQTIVQLTDGGEVAPSFVSSAPTASCITDASASLGLQHDIEAAPKGDVLFNTVNPDAVRSDTQVLVDATDAPGRCHDQGVFGIMNAPQGGLEIIDVTDVANPVEIGLTSHIGEAHTVNVDPKRPHIAYAVTSDLVSQQADANDIDNDGDTEEMIRENDDPADTAGRFDLDGFEVVDFSSCMNFPSGTTVDAKRAACKPEVYRYRYPTADMALGHTIQEGGFGCHELEVYPDDRLTCGSGNALIVLDMSGAFDDMGTPTDYSDDKPRGTPLPCQERASSSEPPFGTGATVIDCVDGTAGDPDGPGPLSDTNDLTVPGWILQGGPSLHGVQYLGSIHHQGGGPGQGSVPPLNSLEDLAFNHEAELSGSGQHLIATDERGGGVVPPGASCVPGGDNTAGNGGVHFYKTSALTQTRPETAEDAQKAYATTPDDELAIYRARVRTKAQATVCTAHVFQQIPRENRIFMGWYSQGTHVLDFVEEDNGKIRFAEAGFFIPENANTWVSHIFKTEDNPDGTTTYYGATGDFNLGEAGRNSIDVYKVTLPPAPKVSSGGDGEGAGACAQRIGGGTNGNDKLLGSIAGDRINGRKGKDKIKGRDGDDCLKGGGGNDRVHGNNGRDELRGGGGKDIMKGNAGRDELRGGRRADRLNGGGGKDVVIDRSGGKDRLGGGGGKDVLKANKGGRDKVDCGPGGRDKAVIDEKDKVRRCERLRVRGGTGASN